MPAPSGKQGCTRRATTALLLATSRAAVADGATPLLSEPRWAPPTNSPQDDDARYADSATALSVRSCSITTGRPTCCAAARYRNQEPLSGSDNEYSQNPLPRPQSMDKVERGLPARRSGLVLNWIWASAMLTGLC